MLKYLYCKEIFKEIPGEISLGISISGCQIKCKGCHSRELWEDKGIPLTAIELDKLIKEHEGITCVCFLGGERDIDILTSLCARIKKVHHLLTAWYCGLDMIPRSKRNILKFLDYYKVGHYDPELGGLDCATTNQKLYRIFHLKDEIKEIDITKELQK
jgi:anaerobic ribonucleoside-triphosphate reductase activating protein